MVLAMVMLGALLKFWFFLETQWFCQYFVLAAPLEARAFIQTEKVQPASQRPQERVQPASQRPPGEGAAGKPAQPP